MEDLQGYMRNSTVSIQGRKKSMDSDYDSLVQSDAKLKGLNGESTGIFSIYAGYGGDSATGLLKHSFVVNLTKQPAYMDNLEIALTSTFESMHSAIKAQWAATHTRHGAAVIACAIRDGHVYMASTGNCCAVLCRAEGEIECFDTATPRIDEKNGTPHMKVVGLDWEDEFFIIGCGGFWSKISPRQAVNMTRVSLKKFHDINHSVQKLSYAAYVNGASSNITVTVIVLNQETAVGPRSRGTKLLDKLRRKSGNPHDSHSSASSSATAKSPPLSPVVYRPGAVHKTGTANKKKADAATSSSTPPALTAISRQMSTASNLSNHSVCEEFDIDNLKDKMSMATNKMDFEGAARLRDRISLVDKMNVLVAEMKFEEASKLRDKISSMKS